MIGAKKMNEAHQTVKQYIDEIRHEAMNDITPERASELLNQLSSLYGSVFEMWVQAEMSFNRYFEKMTDQYEKVTEARTKAKASDEYEQKLRMEGLLKVNEELIRSMKYVIKIKLQEKQESKY